LNTLLFLAALLNLTYLIWLPFHVNGFAGIILFFAEFGLSSLIILFSINHWNRPKITITRTKKSPAVDIFITVVNEPLDLLERVIKSAKEINYTKKKVYVLDDGKREEVAQLANKHLAEYLVRPNRPQDYKAGNLNFGLGESKAPLILTLDADQVVIDPNILNDLVGYFDNVEVALVSTHQSFDVPASDFNHDLMFYKAMQIGKNYSNSAISVGSGSIYRRTALEIVGGFPTWSVVEDMYVSYLLHQAGYKSQYVDKPYTMGTAPIRLPDIAKQRGTWALDSMRVLLRDCPLFKKKLSINQRLQYFEIGYIYLVSALCLPILFILPSISILFNFTLINNPLEYLILRGPSLALAIYTYYLLNGKSFSASQYWSSLSFVYLRSFVLALKKQKPKYTVTAKIPGNNYGLHYTYPHLAILTISSLVIINQAFTVGPTLMLASQVFWTGLSLLWFYPWILKGFGSGDYKKSTIWPTPTPTAMANPPINNISNPWEIIPKPDSLALNTPNMNNAISETRIDSGRAFPTENIR